MPRRPDRADGRVGTHAGTHAGPHGGPHGGGGSRWPAAVVLVVLCVLAAGVLGPWDPQSRGGGATLTGAVELPSFTRATLPPPDLEGPPRETDPPDLRWVGRTLAVVAVTALLVLLARWLIRRQRSPEPAPAGPPLTDPGVAVVAAPVEAEPDARVLEDGARVAEQRLEEATVPAEGVIAAWVALEESAGRSGVTRLPSSTPTEFTMQVLDRTTADGAAARALLDLYLRARFDDVPLSEDDAAAAAAAASALVRTLGAPRAPAPGRWATSAPSAAPAPSNPSNPSGDAAGGAPR